MAELILTDEEKAADLWTDLDDAALGKMMRKRLHEIRDVANQEDKVYEVVAAFVFAHHLKKKGLDQAIFTLTDWPGFRDTVVVKVSQRVPWWNLGRHIRRLFSRWISQDVNRAASSKQPRSWSI